MPALCPHPPLAPASRFPRSRSRVLLWCGRWFTAALVACYLVVAPGLRDTARAHPHIFIDNTVEAVFSAQGLQGIRITWLFDPMTSSQYILDLDSNGDGRLDPEEWRAIRDDIAGFLSEEQFFLYARVNGARVRIPTIRDFIAMFENGILSYTFFAPLSVPRGQAEVVLAVYDPSYYTDFYTAETDIRLTGAPGAAQASLNDAPELAFYGGQVIPVAVRLHF